MRILVISDIHGARFVPSLVRNYLKKETIDCIAINGDITNFGPLSVAEEILSEITDSGILTLVVPGNCDPKDILNIIDDSPASNLHGKSEIIKNIAFAGLGGSNITPFNTPFELTEEEIETTLSKALAGIEEIPTKILITHAPPKNTRADVTGSGMHVGSNSIRKIVEDFQPSVLICAHIHEARVIDKLNNTIIVNPGEASKRRAALIQVEKETSAKLIEL
ncbi:MAG: metallophosphoesterase [Euryarchaeota archaeon]|nr:metallophosphoesterase [Euryarchaeota archaeon]